MKFLARINKMFPLIEDRNIFLLYLYTAVFSMYPILPVIAMFLQHQGFGFTEIGIIVFVFLVSSLLFEVPTGYLGDKFGRRNSIIVGLGCLIVISYLWTVGSGLAVYLIMAAVWMFALSCLSGTTEAFIYDYMKEKKFLDFYDGYISKTSMIVFISSALGMIIGTFAYAVSPELPFYLLSITTGISLVIVLFMDDDLHSLKKASLSKSMNIFSGLKTVLNNKNLFWISIYIAIFYSYDHFFINSVNVPYLVSLKVISISEIGFFLAGMSVIQAFFASKFDYIRRILSDNQIIILLSGLQLGALLGMSYLFGILGLFSYLLFSLIEPFEGLLINSFSQKFVESHIRASTISSMKLMIGVVSSCVGLYAGWLVDQVGIRVSFTYIAIGLFVLLFILLALKKLLKLKI